MIMVKIACRKAMEGTLVFDPSHMVGYIKGGTHVLDRISHEY